jgi:hypothetical protein
VARKPGFALSSELVQKCFGIFEIGSIEALGEPVALVAQTDHGEQRSRQVFENEQPRIGQTVDGGNPGLVLILAKVVKARRQSKAPHWFERDAALS